MSQMEEKKMKMARPLAAIGVTAMMVFTLGAFTGCNANEANEEVIRTSITEELDPYKNHDSTVVNQIRQQNAVALATVGLDGQEYADALLDGFDYTIEDVTVDGSDATATIVMTQKDLDEDQVEAMMDELSEDPEFAEMSLDERKAAVSGKIMEYIASVPAAPQDPVTLEFVLNGNQWEPTDTTTMKLQNLFTF
ncbi:MAG: hypothetical protein HFJ65_05230 [Eggerthellaceae bacterium]|nr:hypothetical protein [Eggerthellaceae bacterium]